MSAFWSGWIAVLVTANVGFALWLLRGTLRRNRGEPAAGPATTGHVWDGDLEEYNNPLPRWWLWLFYLSIAFAVGYLLLYPGLAVYDGELHWSQARQWREQSAESKARYAVELDRLAPLSVPALAGDARAMRIARNLFAANCSMCHGSDARGARGFPNLTAPNFSWGRTPEQLIATIGGGRQGVMPAWREVLGETGVTATAAYVYSLGGGSAPPAQVAAGRTQFEQSCAACHGADASGNVLLGAPNLRDEVWVYGSSLASITESIALGRSNRMPAHQELLGEQQVRLLAAYVQSLTPPPAAAAPADHAPGS